MGRILYPPVSLVYPPSGASELLSPGTTFEIGKAADDAIELYLPDDFPFFTDPQQPPPEGGLERLKLFAIEHSDDGATRLRKSEVLSV